MHYFLDTEFTHLPREGMPEPISIGIVDQNGREYYACLSDFTRFGSGPLKSGYQRLLAAPRSYNYSAVNFTTRLLMHGGIKGCGKLQIIYDHLRTYRHKNSEGNAGMEGRPCQVSGGD